MSTQLDRIEAAIRTLDRKLMAFQEDLVRIHNLRPRPLIAGDRVRCIRPYKGNQWKGIGKIEQVNSWYWRIVLPGVMVSIPKSQASKYLERQ